MNNYTYTYACRNIFNTIKTSGHSSLEKYTSHFIERVVCERKLETEQRLQHTDPTTFLALTAFLSRSPELLNRGPGGPPSAGTWLSFQHLLSNWSEALNTNWSDFLSHPGLYHCSTSTQFNPSIAKAIPWSPDIFNWMHLLFTQVHFFFWLLGRVGSQYAIIFKRARAYLLTHSKVISCIAIKHK